MKGAQLDINETSLVFGVEGLYYLDLNLKYIVNSEEGNAKFDKTKKTLTIRLPITGLTADSQRLAEQHYSEFLEAERKRNEEFKELEMSTVEEDAAKARLARSKPGGAEANNEDEDEDRENREAGDALNGANTNVDDGADGVINEGVEGVSKKQFLMSDDGKDSEPAGSLGGNSKIPASEDDNDKRDSTTK